VPRIVAVLRSLLLVVLMGSAVYVVVTQALAAGGGPAAARNHAAPEALGPDPVQRSDRRADASWASGFQRRSARRSAPAGRPSPSPRKSAAPLAALFGFLHLVVAPLATIAITLL
jgi:hypothetical protein